ncbi:MAG: manganese efflux pump MntP family protein [bacterium]
MSNIDILILAIALSIDACVVSFSNGLVFAQNKRINSLMLASSVGFFQFLMPVIGFFLAQSVNKYVEPYDHWIVFGIFVLLGAKFIKDSFETEKEEKLNCYLCFSYIMLVSVATSIDALGAGVSIAFTGTKILFPALVIGVVTFFNSLLGFWCGHLFKKFPTRNLEISGGLILIGLAFKILFESF